MQLKEIQSLRLLSHPNLIKLFEIIRIDEELSFVFEICEKNLFDYYNEIKQKGEQIPEDKIKSIIFQIANGLAHMHQHGFFHRNLQPSNILLKGETQVKISDFGLVREILSKPPSTEYVGARQYRAPEMILLSNKYNSPVDIFALGCIMAELYNLSPLFCGASTLDQMNKLCEILGTPSQFTWQQGIILAKQIGYNIPVYQKQNLKNIIPRASQLAIDLIEKMLIWDPTSRITAQEILHHQYFEGVQGWFVPKHYLIKKQKQNQRIDSIFTQISNKEIQENEKKRMQSLILLQQKQLQPFLFLNYFKQYFYRVGPQKTISTQKKNEEQELLLDNLLDNTSLALDKNAFLKNMPVKYALTPTLGNFRVVKIQYQQQRHSSVPINLPSIEQQKMTVDIESNKKLIPERVQQQKMPVINQISNRQLETLLRQKPQINKIKYNPAIY